MLIFVMLFLLQTQALYDSQAQPGLDYIPINSGSVRILDCMSYGYLNVTIRDDNIPERDEVFHVSLHSFIENTIKYLFADVYLS